MKARHCFFYVAMFFCFISSTLKAQIRGDVNLDNSVNISDVVAVINVIAGDSQYRETADVNWDSYVNITDIVEIVKIIAEPQPDVCPDSNHPHAIDLGIGVKWSCCNVGASSPEQCGGYYAWGETSEKSNYNWSTYIHCNGSYDTCHNLGSDIGGTSYDVAHVKWGGSWRMPSLEHIKALVNNCSSEWTRMNGVDGRKFIGANGNWWLGNRDSGYYAYSSYYDIGNDVMSSDPNYAGLGYLDIDTYDFYVSIDTIAEGTIFFNTTDGSVERYIDGNWVLEDSIAGSNYTSDTVDPHDADGDDDDWYINTSSGDIFKKQSGSWEVYHNIYNFFTRLNYHFYKFGRNEVHVPKTLKNVTILGDYDINDGAFEGCRYLETVTLKGNVKHIGNRAFKDCLSLQINLPDSLVTIGDSAFENCGKLQSVVLGPNVTSIGKNAFANCNGWTIGQLRSGQSAPRYIQSIRQGDMYIDLSTGNLYFYLEQGWELGKSYGSYTTTNDLSDYDTSYYSEGYLLFVGPDYPGAKKTLYININSTWVNTGLEVYYYYGAPSSGNDYDGCKWYFDGNNNEMYILNNDEWVMGGIRHLTSGQGAPSAAGNAGDYYADVTNDVLYYYDGSSWGIALRNVQMYFAYGTADDNTKAPEDGTLYKDTNTNAYYIFSNNKWNLANGVDIIVASGSVVDPLVNIVEAEIGTYLVANDGASTLYKKDSNGLSIISIGKNVTTIGEGAFRNNRALESVVVPNNVVSIGSGAFQGCNSLKILSIPFVGGDLADSSTQYIGYIFGATYSSYNDEFVPSSLKTIIISGSVTSIGEYAFDHCSSLKEVVLPNGLESIGDYAFEGCASLTSVVIPDSVTTIGDSAFKECSSLKEIYFSASSAINLTIGDYAFFECSELESLNFDKKITISEIGVLAFSRCISLRTFNKYKSVIEEVKNSAFLDCTSLEYVKFENGLTSVGYSAFQGCLSLRTVILPNTGLTKISTNMFIDCVSLTNIVLPSNVVSIEEYAFYGCSSLSTIDLRNIKTIKMNAFENCVGLQTLIINIDVLTKAEDNAFLGCDSVINVIVYVPSESESSNKMVKHRDWFKGTIDGTNISQTGNSILGYYWNGVDYVANANFTYR